MNQSEVNIIIVNLSSCCWPKWNHIYGEPIKCHLLPIVLQLRSAVDKTSSLSRQNLGLNPHSLPQWYHYELNPVVPFWIESCGTALNWIPWYRFELNPVVPLWIESCGRYHFEVNYVVPLWTYVTNTTLSCICKLRIARRELRICVYKVSAVAPVWLNSSLIKGVQLNGSARYLEFGSLYWELMDAALYYIPCSANVT